jgi:DNA-binding transcriptional ArsR family regulator
MDTVTERVSLLRALGDPTRLRLLYALKRGELTVAELTKVVGMSQPRVSHHLKILTDAGLLGRTPDQNEVYYRYRSADPAKTIVEDAIDLKSADPMIRSDLRQLERILDRRQQRAKELLERAGIAQLPDASLAGLAKEIDALIERHIGAGELGDMLDIGTGLGTMLKLVGPRARRVVGVDTSKDMRIVSRALALAEGLADSRICDEDMYALSFDSESFDLVTTDRVLGAADAPVALLRESVRVLRPHGHLLALETAGSAVGEARLGGWLEETGFCCLETTALEDHGVLIALAARQDAQAGPPI